ncbi:M48 family metallopeptidase [Legionella brunensis]|nr:SprT family zinc-dependent metalloprotease [Legionella brunensis]
MVKHQLEIDGILIEVLRKPIKNMHLRIYPPDGQVKVSAPLKFRLETIRKQVEARLDWIHNQRKRLKIPQPTFTVGDSCDFLGKSYPLLIEENLRSGVIFDGSFIQCRIKPQATLAEKKQLVDRWYRQEMKKLLPALIDKWQPILGVDVKAWGIKTMNTRWGSCNIHARRIWLNLRLIRKPLSCLEYVLVHEMVHLLETNHSKRFYALMDKFLPDWRYQQILLES